VGSSNMSLDFPPLVIPDGVSMIKQFELAREHSARTSGRTDYRRSQYDGDIWLKDSVRNVSVQGAVCVGIGQLPGPRKLVDPCYMKPRG
jgi:hypothetical protein